MTAPIWMAAPPEVHSALLSSGPGPGPLLAAAGAWNSLSAEYADVAAELSALVAAVQAGAWQGPSAESYAAANAPYVAWLTEAAADAVATATQQETAAAAYTAALAAMPTLGELAANHAIHGVLLATNFFGINTIPIALNEADYVRMWIQAATTMSTYQGVSTAAVAATPQTAPAPAIVKADAVSDPPSDSGQPGTLTYFLNQLVAYIDGNAPGQGNETLLQYITGVPPGTPVSEVLSVDLSEDEAIVQSLVGFAGNNPALLPLSYLASAAILIEHVSVQFLQFAYTFPGLTAGLATPAFALPAAMAGGAAGFAGLAGLHSPAPVPTGVEAVPAAPAAPVITPAPTPAAAAPAPAAPPAATPAPALAPTAPAPPAPPAPGVPPPQGAAPGPFPYLAGGWTGMHSQASALASAKKKAPEPYVVAAAAAAATAAREKERGRRRRRAKAEMLGRGYEYMDLDDDTGQGPGATASDRGAGTMGFAGTTRREPVAEAAGLTTLAADAFGGGPREPMMPGTWAPEHFGKAREDGDE
ncbi:MAG TPA: PPE family protein [Mycobacterium sp.]|nr:PPE family protein [Mycobacterium sp.]